MEDKLVSVNPQKRTKTSFWKRFVDASIITIIIVAISSLMCYAVYVQLLEQLPNNVDYGIVVKCEKFENSYIYQIKFGEEKYSSDFLKIGSETPIYNIGDTIFLTKTKN